MQLNAQTPKDFTLGSYADLNKWHHVTVVISRSTNLLFYYLDSIDNIPINISAVVGSLDTSAWLGIGQDFSDSSVNFNGLIDDVRIYNRALSASEIKSIYDSTK